MIIRTGGFDHRVSTVQLDWIREPSEAADAAIVSSRMVPEIVASGPLVHDPVLSLDNGRWILTLDATNTHCDPMPTTRWRIGLGPPGKYEVLGAEQLRPGCD